MKRAAPEKEEGTKVDKKLEKALKNYLKNHDPEVIENRNKYANQKDVIERRQVLNQTRRLGATNCMNLLRNFKLVKDDYLYYVVHNRLIREHSITGKKEIVKCDKKGNINSCLFKDEIELLSLNLNDLFPPNENKEYLSEALEKLLDGDEEMENLVKKKKKIIDTELSAEDCYWKKFSEEEKKAFLEEFKNGKKKQP